ncbi:MULTISPECIES: glycosyltransferase family 4 protein [unclassified Methanosarcina]|uniref:glycosyltransferase family 4 protein n=1 Tax=unclassified Methanosarcina TaxID=2644672 RepID=UPI000615CF27|nr:MULTISPECIES: glycosyltransferase family 4 protein [unclassified Methanosarcina]AKB18893.1 Glycosyltransferase [Methanosarcina sp. WWM596]AKB23234.1 Glycosyltransferase [Methanosarcina sp. WH1]
MFKKVSKIFLVYYSSFTTKSGSNIHILELLRNLKKYTDVVLFAPGQKGIESDFPEIKYVPVIDNKYLIQPSYEFILSFYLLYSCIANRPEVLYLRQNSFPFFPIALCKFLGISSIVEVNGLVMDELKVSPDSKSFAYRVFSSLALRSERFNYRYCDRIVSVTDKLKDELVRLYSVPAEKVLVINNGANTDIFKPLDQKQARAELGLDDSKKYVCFVGHLAAWQGVEFLIHSSPFILEKCPEVRFLVVGDGIMKDKLMEIASKMELSDKFTFTGRIPYENVPVYINAANVCVAPFIEERNSKIGLSALKTYEYLACGKPIVASNIPGVKDLIDLSGGGISVPPENPGELANAVVKLISDEETSNAMGERGRKYVVENHSWDGVARKILGICNEIV